MANIIQDLSNRMKQIFLGTDAGNAFNRAFYRLVGGSYTAYDRDNKTYLEKGYNINSIVYSIIQQMATKTSAIPIVIAKVDGDKDKTNDETLEMPLNRPNPTQTWTEFKALYKTQLRLFGNCFIYMLRPDGGTNKGEPLGVYILPADKTNIVLKNEANFLLLDSPIDYYTMIDGEYYNKFMAEDVIHIKLPNPNFDMNGSHLYGQSPLKAGLMNIQDSNEAVKQNVKTMQNSGSYGFIHGKNIPLTPAQAQELKSRMTEMDNSPERLSRIAGISSEVGFTRLNLTTDELKPFMYLDYDQKQLCNVLGWSDKLLNNDAGAKYDNVKEFRKSVMVDNIIPDLNLLQEALNEYFIPLFKGYDNTELYFDYATQAEMQEDLSQLVQWLSVALRDGVITRNEYREALKYGKIDEPQMEELTTVMGILPLEDALMPAPGNMDLIIEE